MTAESVAWVVPDKMGGMMNIVANLLAHREPDGFTHHAILTHNPLQTDARFDQPMAADRQVTVVQRMPVENLYAVLRRLRAALPPGDDALQPHRGDDAADHVGAGRDLHLVLGARHVGAEEDPAALGEQRPAEGLARLL
jgi:hypothetical protein